MRARLANSRLEQMPRILTPDDTARVMGGYLTACLLPEKRFVQVKARRQYYALQHSARHPFFRSCTQLVKKYS